MQRPLGWALVALAMGGAVRCRRSSTTDGADATFVATLPEAAPSQEVTLSPAPADVAAPPLDAATTSSGVATKVLKAGQGTEHPSGDDCMRVRFTGWTRTGAAISTSRSQEEGIVQCLGQVVPGVAEAFRAMTVGEALRAWIPGPLTVNPRNRDAQGPSPDLTFDLELVELLKAPLAPTDLKTPSKGAVRTRSGLALRVLKLGSGKVHPTEASRVTLDMSGWKADGSLIETTIMSKTPVVYPVIELVAGMREGLQHMVLGEKARFWIPAALAYGDKPGRRGVPIGDLVYDIELLAIE